MNKVKNGILAVLVSSFLLSGCGETGVQENNGGDNFSVADQISESFENYPDFNEINKITIGDRTVSLPFKAEELGNQFFIEYYVDEYGKQNDELCLSYNDECIFWVRTNENDEINEIILIEPQLSNLKMYWNIAGIDNINIDNTILDSLGSPTTVLGRTESSLDGTYWYNKDLGNMCLTIADNKLYSISISIY